LIKTTHTWEIGDCKDVMHEMNPDSIDLIVTDPPYGYSFMGKAWDKAVPSVDIWKECLRILKPGAFAFIMSAPRQDVLAHNLVNLSDAGFDTGFTSIYWAYASGFPKASNIGKMVDKRLGAEREVVGKSPHHSNGRSQNKSRNSLEWAKMPDVPDIRNITVPATVEAKSLDGSYGGFQPKPAVEVIMVVMKPLSEKTYVDQAMTNQKGITWLDDGRIPYKSDRDMSSVPQSALNSPTGTTYGFKTGTGRNGEQWNAELQGRFPANLLVSDDVLNNGTSTTSVEHKVNNNNPKNNSLYRDGFAPTTESPTYSDHGSFSRYFDHDAWWDELTKPLPKEVQKTFPFLITPKASKSEKGDCNKHPTVKPVKLFSWLITIGSREGDMVLDPFLGSGTALEAGRITSRCVHGIEIDPQWEHLYRERGMIHTPPLTSYFD
jgi:site-specific DNA-methyltransferase (adenine-specific)